jgi:hypothetical protein
LTGVLFAQDAARCALPRDRVTMGLASLANRANGNMACLLSLAPIAKSHPAPGDRIIGDLIRSSTLSIILAALSACRKANRSAASWTSILKVGRAFAACNRPAGTGWLENRQYLGLSRVCRLSRNDLTVGFSVEIWTRPPPRLSHAIQTLPQCASNCRRS